MQRILLRIVGLVFLVIVVVNFVVNQFIKGMSSEESKPKAAAVVEPISPPEVKTNNYIGKKVIERIHLDSGRQYQVSVFWVDGQEVGQFKFQRENVYDIKGEIPEGKVEFRDETANTYGEENYHKGKRHGDFVEYYKNGAIKRTAQYSAGKRMINKEYFIDGKLRMEEDLSDLLFFSECKDLGVGKIYYRSGVLMYEWNLTKTGPQRFSKAYNIKGELVETKWYDQDGKLSKTEEVNVGILDMVTQPVVTQSSEK